MKWAEAFLCWFLHISLHSWSMDTFTDILPKWRTIPLREIHYAFCPLPTGIWTQLAINNNVVFYFYNPISATGCLIKRAFNVIYVYKIRYEKMEISVQRRSGNISLHNLCITVLLQFESWIDKGFLAWDWEDLWHGVLHTDTANTTRGNIHPFIFLGLYFLIK